MSRPNVPLNIKNARHRIDRAQGAPYIAECLADDGKTYDKANPGYLWVREILSVNPTTGGMVTGQAYQVRATGTFIPYYGARVVVTYDPFDGEWGIDRMDFASFVEQGGNPAVLNPLNPYLREVSMSSLGPLLSFAVSDGNTATTEVSIKNYIGIDYSGDLLAFKLNDDARPDIGDYAPTDDGYKRLVHLWLDYDNTIAVTQSTPISVMQQFDVYLDLAEVMENRPNQLARPIAVWVATYGMTETKPGDLYMDTRQWIDNPPVSGFPNPVEKPYAIPAGITETFHGDLVITSDLIVLGDLIIMDNDSRLTSVGGTFGDIAAGNYSIFLDDGILEMNGTARVEKEVAVSLDNIGKGATAPTLTRLGNTVGYAFTISDDGYMQFEVPADWDATTDIEILLHIYTNDAWVETSHEAETQWQGLWACIPEDGTEAVDAATHTGTLDSGDIAIPTVTKALQEIELGTIAAASIAQHDIICVKLSRVALDGGTNPSQEPVLIHAEYEYTANRLGLGLT